jgi:CDP-diacylglycerol--glycerol-3-phosphate 3-phosphatidyltransferase
MDLYATKGAINARLVPLVDHLAAAGVTPDALTLAAIPVALAGTACLLLSRAAPILLAVVPLIVGLRILLNLLDGNMARRTGRIHARGELFNETGDRVADIALLAPPAFLPGASPEIVLFGVLAAVMASYVGITARAAGGERLYGGILSKPGRMTLLVACSLAALVAGTGGGVTAWTVFGPLLLAGTLATFAERLLVAIRRLP